MVKYSLSPNKRKTLSLHSYSEVPATNQVRVDGLLLDQSQKKLKIKSFQNTILVLHFLTTFPSCRTSMPRKIHLLIYGGLRALEGTVVHSNRKQTFSLLFKYQVGLGGIVTVLPHRTHKKNHKETWKFHNRRWDRTHSGQRPNKSQLRPLAFLFIYLFLVNGDRITILG